MRTNLLISLTIFIALYSCKSKEYEGDGYVINAKTGTVIVGSTVYLEEMVDNQFVKRDSTTIGEDSSFTFKGTVSEPSFYRVLLANSQSVILVLQNTEKINLEFNSNPEIGNTYTVKGSKQNEYLQEMNFLDANFQEQTRQLREQHSIAVQRGNKDAQLDAFKRYEELRLSYNKQYKTFIDTAQTSIVVIMVANSYLSFDDDIAFLENVANRYKKELPNSKYTKQFVDRVTLAKKVAVGSIATDFTLKTIDGKAISLSSMKGKVLLVDFWASWCGPCRQENPNVVKVYNEFKNKGFDVLGVSLDNDKDAWQGAIKKDGLTWNHVSDLKGWDSEVVKSYSITGIPFTLLLDKDGKIIAKNLRGEMLKEKLLEVLKQVLVIQLYLL